MERRTPRALNLAGDELRNWLSRKKQQQRWADCSLHHIHFWTNQKVLLLLERPISTRGECRYLGSWDVDLDTH